MILTADPSRHHSSLPAPLFLSGLDSVFMGQDPNGSRWRGTYFKYLNRCRFKTTNVILKASQVCQAQSSILTLWYGLKLSVVLVLWDSVQLHHHVSPHPPGQSCWNSCGRPEQRRRNWGRPSESLRKISISIMEGRWERDTHHTQGLSPHSSKQVNWNPLQNPVVLSDSCSDFIANFQLFHLVQYNTSQGFIVSQLLR